MTALPIETSASRRLNAVGDSSVPPDSSVPHWQAERRRRVKEANYEDSTGNTLVHEAWLPAKTLRPWCSWVDGSEVRIDPGGATEETVGAQSLAMVLQEPQREGQPVSSLHLEAVPAGRIDRAARRVGAVPL